MVLCHEAPNPGHGTVFPQTDNLATVLNTVVLQGLERDGLAPPLRLLGLGEHLFFAVITDIIT